VVGVYKFTRHPRNDDVEGKNHSSHFFQLYIVDQSSTNLEKPVDDVTDVNLSGDKEII
jgi:hypothetical protein